MARLKSAREELLFRPFGAANLPRSTHGLRRGLHSGAAPRLIREHHPTARARI